MFLQVHFLTSYHASLLNRDDAGLAKRIIFGGEPRLRVSSQAQKRHWREWMIKHTKLPSGWRTREFFSRVIFKRLIDEGLEEQKARQLTLDFAKGILHAAGERDALDPQTLQMKQPVLFGKPEADYFVRLLKEADKQGDEAAAKTYLDEKIKAMKDNIQALLKQAGLKDLPAGFEGALFGRFVTSDILARPDAPVHVAHAFTTHALETEVDFFTVVDDLAREEETGAAHANDMELGAGIFYGYVVVDVPLLMRNLTGCDCKDWRSQDPEDARALLDLLIHAITQVTPGAKLGATAPYARAECVVLETGTSQPRSLANAFLRPVSLGGRTHPMVRSSEAMASYIQALEAMYGKPEDEKRYVSTLHPDPWKSQDILPLDQAIQKSLDEIFGEMA